MVVMSVDITNFPRNNSAYIAASKEYAKACFPTRFPTYTNPIPLTFTITNPLARGYHDVLAAA